MANRDRIVIGASAGGVQALSKLVQNLPPDLPAAVFIVLHIPARAPSLLPGILSRGACIPVAHAVNGEEITPGRAYVAPPDHHLLLENDHIKRAQEAEEHSSIIRQVLLTERKGDIAEPLLEIGTQLTR